MDGDKKPYAVVLLIQLIYTGLYVISKAALDEGLSTFIFIFYRQAAATILLVPLAFYFERYRSCSSAFHSCQKHESSCSFSHIVITLRTK